MVSLILKLMVGGVGQQFTKDKSQGRRNVFGRGPLPSLQNSFEEQVSTAWDAIDAKRV